AADAAALPSSAHTYRLLLVKEPGLPGASRRAVKALCLSAAEKRDYAVFAVSCQRLFCQLRKPPTAPPSPAARALRHRPRLRARRCATGAELYQTFPNPGKRFPRIFKVIETVAGNCCKRFAPEAARLQHMAIEIADGNYVR
ncbi:MAG TPA: hypothetical protein VHK70_02800, partial [Burkholderiaceae bacterium]|nr:hypothetical protein [Burkholderiaceae bacterium]